MPQAPYGLQVEQLKEALLGAGCWSAKDVFPAEHGGCERAYGGRVSWTGSYPSLWYQQTNV